MSLRKYILTLLICLFAGLGAQAQIAPAVKKAIKEINKGNYQVAFNYLNELLYDEPNNADAKFYASICYLESHSPTKALEYLNSLKGSSYSGSPQYKFRLAQAYYLTGKFNQALQLFAEVSGDPLYGGAVERYVEAITHAKKHYVRHKNVVVRNLGDKINTKHREYSSVMTKDHKTILFTSRQHDTGKASKDGMDTEIILRTTTDSNDVWQEPEVAESGIVTSGHDAPIQLFDNDKKMVIYHDGDLYLSEKIDGKWQRGEPLKEVNTFGYESHCFITNDGNTIYFASNYYSDGDDLDLFVIHKDGSGDWSKPEPMIGLNTDFPDDSPFLAEDGTFYFSSKGHDSMGGYDIFAVRYDSAKGEWGEPINLGYPINSIFDDTYYTTFGKVAYFSSSRVGGYGSLDVYRAILFDKVNMKGQVRDSDGKAVSAAIIRVENGTNIFEASSDVNGNYSIFLPVDQSVKITIVKDKTVLHEESYIVKVIFEDVNKNNFDFNIPVKDFSVNVPTTVRHVEDVAANAEDELEPIPINLKAVNNFEDNDMFAEVYKPGVPETPTVLLPESEWGKDVAEEEETSQPLVAFPTDPGEYETPAAPALGDDAKPIAAFSNKVAATWSIEPFQKDESLTFNDHDLDIGKAITLKHLYFDFNETMIKEVAYSELDHVVRYLKKHPNTILEIGGHTDNIGSYETNVLISERRAKSVALYLQERGIPKENLSPVGYGESQPLASNDDELEGRELNRRTEIKVLRR